MSFIRVSVWVPVVLSPLGLQDWRDGWQKIALMFRRSDVWQKIALMFRRSSVGIIDGFPGTIGLDQQPEDGGIPDGGWF